MDSRRHLTYRLGHNGDIIAGMAPEVIYGPPLQANQFLRKVAD
jgi:hypothetical protein